MSIWTPPTQTATNFNLDVRLGRLPGISIEEISATVKGEGVITTEKHYWQLDQGYTFLSANTQLYASSTSALDVGNFLIQEGYTDDYQKLAAPRTAILNGQNQVPLSGELFRTTRTIVPGGGSTQGDIYIAEADTLTGGVPDDPTKIKNFLRAGDNIGYTGSIVVEDNHTFFLNDITLRFGKGQAAIFRIFVTGDGGNPINSLEFELYEQHNQVEAILAPVAARSTIDISIIPQNPGLKGTAFFGFYQVRNDLINS